MNSRLAMIGREYLLHGTICTVVVAGVEVTRSYMLDTESKPKWDRVAIDSVKLAVVTSPYVMYPVKLGSFAASVALTTPLELLDRYYYNDGNKTNSHIAVEGTTTTLLRASLVAFLTVAFRIKPTIK